MEVGFTQFTFTVGHFMASSIQVPFGVITGRKKGSNFVDIIPQTGEFAGQEAISFVDNLPELQNINSDAKIAELIGASISINRIRQGDRKVICNALPWAMQSEKLKKIAFKAEETQSKQTLDLADLQQDFGLSKRVSGKIRDPRTEQAFDKLMTDRGINQTEAVEVAICHGLKEMGYME